MTASPGFTPTAEQQTALDLFATGESMIIEAAAGTGKTSTLRLLAGSAPQRRGQYLAFNKALVTDAQGSFPSNVACSTAHSLAFRAVGTRYARRLRSSARMRSTEIARALRIEPFVCTYEEQRKVLAAGYLAGLTMRALVRFCQTADAEPARHHFPYVDGIDDPGEDGTRSYGNNDELRALLLPALQRAWADATDVNGTLPYKHDYYLKAFERSGPRLAVDFILFDEAQDASPVLLSIVEQQADHAQIVLVGDSNQAIYGFTGAVDALASTGYAARARLSQSFRFGDAVAGVANEILAMIPGNDMTVLGLGSIASVVGPVADADVILCRTNATAVGHVMASIARGERPHMVGGGGEIVRFAKAAKELQTAGYTSHPELACFSSWAEVQEYVDADQQGDELRLMVRMIDEFGSDKIIAALESMPREDAADLIVSTAHKSKGREWNAVVLAHDFPPVPTGVEELRLLYVAVTRAKVELDVTACALLNPAVSAQRVDTTPGRTKIEYRCSVCAQPVRWADDAEWIHETPGGCRSTIAAVLA